MPTKELIQKAEEIIQKAPPEEQRKLLADLPHLLRFELSDLFFLKLAEKSFEFWNNPDDVIYDSL